MTTRESRSNRADKPTRNVTYKPPSLLDAPEPPEGYVHRWIRTSVMGHDDIVNVTKKMRVGWEPVKAEEYPDWHPPTIEGGKHDGVIGHSGLILCRLPKEMADAIKDYNEGRAQKLDDAVTNDYMSQENPAMPMTAQKKTSVTKGSQDDFNENI